MKNRIIGVLLATSLIAFSGAANAQQWSAVLGSGLTKMFANKTHIWTEDGTEHTGYFESAGRIMLLEGSDLIPSLWRIYSGKSVCIVSRIDDHKRCYEYQTDGDGNFRMNQKDNSNTNFDLKIVDGIKDV